MPGKGAAEPPKANYLLDLNMCYNTEGTFQTSLLWWKLTRAQPKNIRGTYAVQETRRFQSSKLENKSKLFLSASVTDDFQICIARIHVTDSSK